MIYSRGERTVKTAGTLGGMRPPATVDLVEKIVKNARIKGQ
jgi:aspartate/glutamate racemase